MDTSRPVCVSAIPLRVQSELARLAAPRLNQLIEAAVSACGMDLLQLDPTVTDPFPERQLLDSLLLSDAFIFDISESLPEVFYLLGIRLALQPESTILLQREGTSCHRYPALPRPLEYRYTALIDEQAVHEFVELLSRRLSLARSAPPGAEMEYYHLMREYRGADISRTKTDRFRATIRYRQDLKSRLADARGLGVDDSLTALRQIEQELNPICSVDSAALVDLFLSYRAESSWMDICRLYTALPLPMKRAVMIREQYALALNRLGSREMALSVLKEIEAVQGPSSETCSLIGRVYKDLWQDCESFGDVNGSRQFLSAAIDSYRRGFEADWRDAYPGINLVTLLDVEGSAASVEERDKLLPIVRFAAERRVGSERRDYWDYATLLELAVLGNDVNASDRFLCEAIERASECWQLETTANNLKLLQRCRYGRQEVGWMDAIVRRIQDAAKTVASGKGAVAGSRKPA